jgi:thiosulfate dehydrogenase (quinone) large subunit
MQTPTVNQTGKFQALVKDPPIAKWLFSDTRSAPLWLVIRVWLGLQWFAAGWSHAMFWDFGKGTWLQNGGSSLKSYWDRALTTPAGGRPPITYDWYFDFIKVLTDGGHYTWFAWVITFGEMAVGLGLIFGCLTGIAAFFGTIMNFSFLMAGTTSTNPILFGTAIFIILAWKNAGWWGLDRFVLPALGTPWQAGNLFSRKTKTFEEEDERRIPPTGGIPLS